jgi:chaperonin cofactor prefoldin
MYWDEKNRQERLLGVVTHNLGPLFFAIDYQELPDELKNRLDDLHGQLTKHSSFEESIRMMQDDQVEQIIAEIVNIYLEFCDFERYDGQKPDVRVDHARTDCRISKNCAAEFAAI